MRIGITGASGFIGSELSEYLAKSGFQVIRMQRREPVEKIHGTEYYYFDLINTVIADELKLDALVHCAVITKSKQNPGAFHQNIESTIRLKHYCRKNNIHFIFLSTMSAHKDALSVYGRHKFYLEGKLDETRDTILKAGLVIGQSGGLFNTIKQTIQKSGFIPLVNHGIQPLQTISIFELCALIEKIVNEKITGKYTIASFQVVTLKQLYSSIAAAVGKQVKFVSVPYWLLYFVLRTLEIIGIPLAVGTENLMGLKQLKSYDTTEDLKKLGINLLNTETTIQNLFSKKEVLL